MVSQENNEKEQLSSKTTALTTSALSTWNLEVAQGASDQIENAIHTQYLETHFCSPAGYHKTPLEATAGQKRGKRAYRRLD